MAEFGEYRVECGYKEEALVRHVVVCYVVLRYGPTALLLAAPTTSSSYYGATYNGATILSVYYFPAHDPRRHLTVSILSPTLKHPNPHTTTTRLQR